MTDAPGRRSTDRLAGVTLTATAVASLLFMANHPTNVDGGSHRIIVHGALIILLSVQAFGFAHLSMHRGLDRPAVLGALIAYGIGLFATIMAATFDGFILSAVGARGTLSRDIFLLIWESNQAFAKIGVYATGIAFILWSFDFVRWPGAWNRFAGMSGLAAGAAPIILLASGSTSMNGHGAFLVYAIFWTWAALLGIALIRAARSES